MNKQQILFVLIMNMVHIPQLQALSFRDAALCVSAGIITSVAGKYYTKPTTKNYNVAIGAGLLTSGIGYGVYAGLENNKYGGAFTQWATTALSAGLAGLVYSYIFALKKCAGINDPTHSIVQCIFCRALLGGGAGAGVINSIVGLAVKAGVNTLISSRA